MGLAKKKVEGDLKTPRGSFNFRYLMYRSDRISNIRTKLEKIKIKKKFGWCDDTSSNDYNKLIQFPFKKKAERLYLKENVYDLILVMNYNVNPILKNKGSAIFLHLAKPGFPGTEGCIAIEKEPLFEIAKNITDNSKIIIEH